MFNFLPRLNLIIIALTASIALALPAASLAAGGGGGGGGIDTPPPPSCTADTWECGAWARCSLAGKQTRACTLTNNCPTAETPRPAEEEQCTPECTSDTWECGAWVACGTNNKQTRDCTLKFDCPLTNNPKPSEEQSCLPGCNQDEWECGNFGTCENGQQSRSCSLTFDCPTATTLAPPTEKSCTPTKTACGEDEFICTSWSQCQADGRERRKCALNKDCPTVKTTKPNETRVCPGLKCGHLPTLRERIACRLNATPEEMQREFKILYFPEYCRAESEANEQKECIKLYQNFGGCWQLKGNAERDGCARKILKLNSAVEARARCAGQTGAARSACYKELREQTEHFILFHLYELEVWAEAKLLSGQASLTKVADFEVLIENKKVALEKAKNLKEWRQIIAEALAAWKQFTANPR